MGQLSVTILPRNAVQKVFFFLALPPPNIVLVQLLPGLMHEERLVFYDHDQCSFVAEELSVAATCFRYVDRATIILAGLGKAGLLLHTLNEPTLLLYIRSPRAHITVAVKYRQTFLVRGRYASSFGREDMRIARDHEPRHVRSVIASLSSLA